MPRLMSREKVMTGRKAEDRKVSKVNRRLVTDVGSGFVPDLRLQAMLQ